MTASQSTVGSGSRGVLVGLPVQWLFLQLLVNLPRAEIDALDEQCAAKQIKGETNDH